MSGERNLSPKMKPPRGNHAEGSVASNALLCSSGWAGVPLSHLRSPDGQQGYPSGSGEQPEGLAQTPAGVSGVHLSCCASLGESLPFSGPQCPHLQSLCGDVNMETVRSLPLPKHPVALPNILGMKEREVTTGGKAQKPSPRFWSQLSSLRWVSSTTSPLPFM